MSERDQTPEEIAAYEEDCDRQAWAHYTHAVHCLIDARIAQVTAIAAGCGFGLELAQLRQAIDRALEDARERRLPDDVIDAAVKERFGGKCDDQTLVNDLADVLAALAPKKPG